MGRVNKLSSIIASKAIKTLRNPEMRAALIPITVVEKPLMSQKNMSLVQRVL